MLRKKLLINLIAAGVITMPLSGYIYAKESNIEYDLDQVVVTATKTDKSINEVASSVSVITREMIDNSPHKSVSGLLTTVPGIAIETRGSYGGITGISMRGLNGGPGSSKMLLLIDGRPANLGYDGSINWNAVPLDNVERIEVIRGPASALYGANAIGGVVNIITKKPDKNSTTVSAKYGSFNTQLYSFTHSGRTDKLGYMITASSDRTDGHRKYNDYEGQNYTLRLDYDVNDNSSLSLMAGVYNSDRNVAGSITSPGNFYRNKEDSNYIDLQSKTINGKATSIIRVYTNASKSESTSSGSLTNVNSRMEDRNTGLMLQQDIALAQKKIFTWGFDYQKQTATNLISSQDFDANTSALYMQLDQALNDKFNVNLGARYDHHSGYGGQLSPKIGAVYQATPSIRVRANIAKSFKAPSLVDLYSTSSSSLGDPNLKPTEMWTYELGVEKQINPSTTGKFTLYKSNAKNMIINERQPDGTRRKKNVGNIRPQGFEVEFDRKINDKWHTFLNYTYLDVGDMTYLAAHHKFNIGINYNMFPYKISLIEQYVGPSWGSDYFRNPISEHSVTNIKFIYAPKETYELSLGIENLFDYDYEVYRDYPMPGRTYTASLQLKF